MATRVKIKRKDLKEPDQFISTTDVVVAYFSQHKKVLFSGIAAFVLIVFAVIGVRYNNEVKSLRMESLYFEMEKVRNAKDPQSEKVTDRMEKLLTEFSEGQQKQRATLMLADELYRTREYERAISLYQDLLKSTRPDQISYQLASMGVAYSLEGKKDYKQAIAAYKTIIEKPSGYPLFHVYLSLARCYELNNEQNGALLTLREMKEKFSGHSKQDIVDSRLKELEGQT
jgi:predicted negative regulator of RcsB-dependent stress response